MIYSRDESVSKSSDHGGARIGAGRKKTDQPRCFCGKMTVKCSAARRHKCGADSKVAVLLARDTDLKPHLNRIFGKSAVDRPDLVRDFNFGA